MNSKIVLTSVLAMAAATPAFAQEAAPQVGGPRIEVRAGLDHVVADLAGDSGSKNGFSYGAEIGYDLPISQVVVGVYGGVDLSTTKECSAVFGNDQACIKAKRNFTVGARLGAQALQGALVYVKGGYSNGRVKGAYRDFAAPVNNQTVSGNLDGFHLGAGVEMNLSSNVYGKVEYVYTDYNTGNDFNVDVDMKRHQALVGFGIRF